MSVFSRWDLLTDTCVSDLLHLLTFGVVTSLRRMCNLWFYFFSVCPQKDVSYAVSQLHGFQPNTAEFSSAHFTSHCDLSSPSHCYLSSLSHCYLSSPSYCYLSSPSHCDLCLLGQTSVSFQGHHWDVKQGLGQLWLVNPDTSMGHWVLSRSADSCIFTPHLHPTSSPYIFTPVSFDKTVLFPCKFKNFVWLLILRILLSDGTFYQTVLVRTNSWWALTPSWQVTDLCWETEKMWRDRTLVYITYQKVVVKTGSWLLLSPVFQRLECASCVTVLIQTRHKSQDMYISKDSLVIN